MLSRKQFHEIIVTALGHQTGTCRKDGWYVTEDEAYAGEFLKAKYYEYGEEFPSDGQMVEVPNPKEYVG